MYYIIILPFLQKQDHSFKRNTSIIKSKLNHNRLIGNICHIFRNYLKGKPGKAFTDGIDVFLTDKDNVIPDAVIVCKEIFYDLL